MNINIRRIPNFIKASSASGLRRLCLKNNLRTQKEHNYKIMHDGKSFYAWFFEEAELKVETKDGKLKLNINEDKEKEQKELKENAPVPKVEGL